ncbi:MAG: hypothetical protein HZA48_09625 [Planctomycetes bacterium]|nr:hypothetical protein [Planctomycetota bacterium]
MNKFLSYVKNNYGNLILALLLAIISWVFINEELTDEQTLSQVPMEISLPPNSGMRVLNVLNDYDSPGAPVTGLQISVKGPKSEIKKLEYQSIIFKCKLTLSPNNSSMEYSLIPAEQGFFSVPKRTAVTDVYPPRLKILLDKEMTKMMLINADNAVTGNQQEYNVRITNPRPQTVKVTGPEKIIGISSEIKIEPVDVSAMSSSLYDFPVYLQNNIDGYPVTCEEKIIKVDLLMEEPVETYSARGIKIDILCPDQFNYSVELVKKEISVEIIGPKSEIEKLKNKQPSSFIRIFADVPGLLQANNTIQENTPQQCPLKSNLSVDNPSVRIKEPDLGTVNIIFHKK